LAELGGEPLEPRDRGAPAGRKAWPLARVLTVLRLLRVLGCQNGYGKREGKKCV